MSLPLIIVLTALLTPNFHFRRIEDLITNFVMENGEKAGKLKMIKWWAIQDLNL